MTLPVIPGSLFAAFELNLADMAEAVVGNAERFLDKINETFHHTLKIQI
jgi:hypothetical protein